MYCNYRLRTATLCALAHALSYVAGGLGLRFRRNIVYRTAAGRSLLLDICSPLRRKNCPVLVYIHGGSWTSGGKDQGRAMLAAYARRGYVGVSIQYRLADKFPWPAQMEDCRAAVEWLQEHAAEYGGDPGRIVLVGASAGAQLAMSLACGWSYATASGEVLTERLPAGTIRACVSWFGPVDLVPMATKQDPLKDVLMLLGHDDELRARNAALASPIRHLTADSPPMLLIHGTADLMVPSWHSERMHAALQELGISSTLITVPGGRHGYQLAGALRLIALNERMLDWVDKIV